MAAVPVPELSEVNIPGAVATVCSTKAFDDCPRYFTSTDRLAPACCTSYGTRQASAELVVPRSIPTFTFAYPFTFSRTLNSSFHLRPSRATHHNCSTPVSVMTVSNDTGTTSDDTSPDGKLTSMCLW